MYHLHFLSMSVIPEFLSHIDTINQIYHEAKQITVPYVREKSFLRIIVIRAISLFTRSKWTPFVSLFHKS